MSEDRRTVRDQWLRPRSPPTSSRGEEEKHRDRCLLVTSRPYLHCNYCRLRRESPNDKIQSHPTTRRSPLSTIPDPGVVTGQNGDPGPIRVNG